MAEGRSPQLEEHARGSRLGRARTRRWPARTLLASASERRTGALHGRLGAATLIGTDARGSRSCSWPHPDRAGAVCPRVIRVVARRFFALGRGAPRARRPGVNNDLVTGDRRRARCWRAVQAQHSSAESTGRPPAEQQQQQQLSSSRRRKGRGAAAAGSSSSSSNMPLSRDRTRCAGGVASRRAPRRVRPRASSRERRCYELL